MDKQIIDGQWYVGYSVHAVRQRETDTWHEVDVKPLRARALAFQINMPELWRRRDDVVDKVKTWAEAMGVGDRPAELSDEHWGELAEQLPEYFGDDAAAGAAGSAAGSAAGTAEAARERKRRHGLALKRLFDEATTSRSRVLFLPPVQERKTAGEWTHAKVVRPVLAVEGTFVLWPKGAPAHRVYPHLHGKLRALPTLPVLGVPRTAERAGVAQALVLYVSGARELLAPAHLGGDGALLNPYVELAIGAKPLRAKLLTRPILRTAAPEWAERFVLMVNGPVDGLGALPVQVTVRHRAPDAAGGPPVIAAELDRWVDEVLRAALLDGIEQDAQRHARHARDAAAAQGTRHSSVIGHVGDALNRVFGAGWGARAPAGRAAALAHGTGADGKVWRFPSERRPMDETIGTSHDLFLASLLERDAPGGLPAAGTAVASFDLPRAALDAAAMVLGGSGGAAAGPAQRQLRQTVRVRTHDVPVSIAVSSLLSHARVPARIATRSLERIAATLPAAAGGSASARLLAYGLHAARNSSAVTVSASHQAVLAQRAHGVLREDEIAEVLAAALGSARAASGVVLVGAAYVEWDVDAATADVESTALMLPLPPPGARASGVDASTAALSEMYAMGPLRDALRAPAHNPYDLPARRCALQRFGWESAEAGHVRLVKDHVLRALDADARAHEQLVRAARELSLRVHGRRLEYVFAEKRELELQLLDSAARFVTSYALEARKLSEGRGDAMAAGSGLLQQLDDAPSDVANVRSLGGGSGPRGGARPTVTMGAVSKNLAAGTRSMLDAALGRASTGTAETGAEWAKLTGERRRYELMEEDEACVLFIESLVRVQHALVAGWLVELRERMGQVRDSRRGGSAGAAGGAAGAPGLSLIHI